MFFRRLVARGVVSMRVLEPAFTSHFLRTGRLSASLGLQGLTRLLFADLPPFVMCQGQPAQARSMNFEGLRRRGFSPERIAAVKAMHKALYREDLKLEQSVERIRALTDKTPEAAPDVEMMVTFLGQVSPQRGIVR